MKPLLLLTVLSHLLTLSSAASSCPPGMAQYPGNYTEDPTMALWCQLCPVRDAAPILPIAVF